MYRTECERANCWTTWLRVRGGRWHRIVDAASYDDCEMLAHLHLQALNSVPGLVETHTCRVGEQPPFVGVK